MKKEYPPVVFEEKDGDPRCCWCPVCGECFLYSYDVCWNCGWENDPDQAMEPDAGGWANQMSLNEARKAYENDEWVH